MCCVLLYSSVMVLLIIVIGSQFTGTMSSSQKFTSSHGRAFACHMFPFTHQILSFFAKRELSRPFYHLIVSAIQLLVVVWATPFGYLLSLPCSPFLYVFTYLCLHCSLTCFLVYLTSTPGALPITLQQLLVILVHI